MTGCAVRVAAIGDVHLGVRAAGSYRPLLDDLPARADLLVLAGDLTRHGTVEEAKVVATEFGEPGVPVVAVLGNHDHHGDAPDEIIRVLENAGIRVVEGDCTEVRARDCTVAIAGVKGFGIGFPGGTAADFGEPEMKAFAGHGKAAAASLRNALEAASSARPDLLVALMHYAPVRQTLNGEPPEIFPFLGSHLLGEALDASPQRVDIAIHGHAHAGSECGRTAGGVPVRNVARPVVRKPYAVYELAPMLPH